MAAAAKPKRPEDKTTKELTKDLFDLLDGHNNLDQSYRTRFEMVGDAHDRHEAQLSELRERIETNEEGLKQVVGGFSDMDTHWTARMEKLEKDMHATKKLTKEVVGQLVKEHEVNKKLVIVMMEQQKATNMRLAALEALVNLMSEKK
jgi:hypothetical protein